MQQQSVQVDSRKQASGKQEGRKERGEGGANKEHPISSAHSTSIEELGSPQAFDKLGYIVMHNKISLQCFKIFKIIFKFIEKQTSWCSLFFRSYRAYLSKFRLQHNKVKNK